MAYWKSAALVLRVTDYGETSQIATLLTRERGKVAAIAKGAKRRGSRLLGVLEPVTLVEAVLIPPRESGSLHTLTELDVRDTYRGCRGELKRLYAAAYVVEFLREVCAEEDPQPRMFDLARETLERLAKGCEPTVVISFEARALHLLGLFPEVFRCVECRKELGAGAAGPPRPLRFSVRLSGVLCEACAGADLAARKVSPGALRVLAALGEEDALASRLRFSESQRAEIRRLLDLYVASALERELRLAKYLE